MRSVLSILFCLSIGFAQLAVAQEPTLAPIKTDKQPQATPAAAVKPTKTTKKAQPAPAPAAVKKTLPVQPPASVTKPAITTSPPTTSGPATKSGPTTLPAPGAVSPVRGIAPNASKPKYIFWHLSPSEGATPELTAQTEKTTRSFFEQSEGNLLMDSLTMDSLLFVEGNEKYMRCGIGMACLIGLAEAAGVGNIIAGELRHRDGANRLDLMLIDANKKTVVLHGVVEFTGEIQTNQLEELRLAMFESDRYRGEIKLACSVDGAEVFIDGIKAGVTPLALPIKNVVAGAKKIEVTKPGHQSFIADFYLAPGKTKEVVASLSRLAGTGSSGSFFSVAPFYKSPLFWTLTGTGAAGLVAAIWLNVSADKHLDNANYIQAHHLSGYQSEKDQADNQRLGATIAYAASGLMLIAAGTIAALDLLGATSRNDDGHADSSDVHAGIIPSYNGAMVTATWRF